MALWMDYSGSEIRNPYVWKSRKSLLFSKIYVVFSLYPEKFENWIIPFDTLLNKRLESLYQIAPELKRDKVSVEIIFQTVCKTKECAVNLFHGILIQKSIASKNITGFFKYEELKFNNADMILLMSGFINENEHCGSNLRKIVGFVNHHNLLFIANSGLGIFVSKDGGNNFKLINKRIEDAAVNTLNSFKEDVICGTTKGLFKFDYKREEWI